MNYQNTEAQRISHCFVSWHLGGFIKNLRLVCVAAVSLGFLTSCTTGTHSGERYAVNSQRTLFYKYGPAQATGPDLALYKGQQVTMQSRAFGYSHITTDDGQSGYVATEDLIPAPPPPEPLPTPTLASTHGSSNRRSRNSEQTHGRRPSREEESQVPAPDLPKLKLTPPPELNFRY
jgi:hypothetical protein